MIRKSFILIGIAVLVLATAAGICGCTSYRKTVERYGLTMREDVVFIEGLAKERTIVLAADTHISLCDERDGAVAEKAAQRYQMFASLTKNPSDVNFRHMAEVFKQMKPDLIVLAGDITDSAMEASIEFVKSELEKTGVPWVYSMGNHDFEYGSEYFSAKAYEEYLPRLSVVSKAENGWQALEYDDLIVFMTDDASNKISAAALEALKEYGAKGKPIVLANHVPLEPQTEDKTLWEKSIEVWRADGSGRSRVLLGYNSCIPDETTAEFLSYVMAEDSPVKLVLAGHVHFYHRDSLNGKLEQIITGAGYEGEFTKITLKPAK